MANQQKPFEELDRFYRQYEDLFTKGFISLIQGILFVGVIIAIFALLLATGIFVF